MTLHREGRKMLILFFVILAALVWTAYVWWPGGWWLVGLAAVVFYGLIVQFFRYPKRPLPAVGDHLVYAPADGKVVVIETTAEPEVFQDQRIQVSIFMSPLNVHANRHPISGDIAYYRYHPGKYLVAWHPKSSTENERSTIVYRGKKVELLVRQIAGAMARRIKTYVQEGQQVQQGEDLGFITFGSRVDVFFPVGTALKVKIGDEVRANVDVLAEV
jgi:phosphatidylserine decarboxylase